MLKSMWHSAKKKIFKLRSFLLAKLIKKLLALLFWTCRIQIKGVEQFCEYIAKEKTILMLWHNQIALVPFILFKYTPPKIQFTALVSASRDGDILSNIIHSYKNGNTLRVPHLGRYQALKNIIRHVEERQSIMIITPDGPRGPIYKIKPGIVVAALETQAYIFSLNWEADRYWEFKTWDRFRLPKPFSKLEITFSDPVRFDKTPKPSIEEAQAFLEKRIPKAKT